MASGLRVKLRVRVRVTVRVRVHGMVVTHSRSIPRAEMGIRQELAQGDGAAANGGVEVTGIGG